MSRTVQEIMTTRVIWVVKDATFREMAVALREHRVSAFPVVDDDHRVIGVVSEADLLNWGAGEPNRRRVILDLTLRFSCLSADDPATDERRHEVVEDVAHGRKPVVRHEARMLQQPASKRIVFSDFAACHLAPARKCVFAGRLKRRKLEWRI